MDPNANLAEQLRLANAVLAAESDEPGERDVRLVRLSELVVSLHEWLSGGGFKPDIWTHRAK